MYVRFQQESANKREQFLKKSKAKQSKKNETLKGTSNQSWEKLRTLVDVYHHYKALPLVVVALSSSQSIKEEYLYIRVRNKRTLFFSLNMGEIILNTLTEQQKEEEEEEKNQRRMRNDQKGRNRLGTLPEEEEQEDEPGPLI